MKYLVLLCAKTPFMIKKLSKFFLFCTPFFFLFFVLQNFCFLLSDASLTQTDQEKVSTEIIFDKKDNCVLASSPGIHSPFIKINSGLENIAEPIAKRVSKSNFSGKFKSFYGTGIKANSICENISVNPKPYSLPCCIVLHQFLI